MNFSLTLWQGVVEDVNDPLKLGRCRVRIIGFHSENKADIPTDHLPWAAVSQPTTSAALSGIGFSPSGLLPGSWVIGFFRDGTNQQDPLIIGSIPGISIEKPGSEIGFSDPSGTYPLDSYLNEPDTNKLARNEDIQNTVVYTKNINLEKDIFGALNTNTWSEPATPYNASYPKNHVMQTESGHIQEFDDTPGSERIHTYHSSGTFNEIHPTGDQVYKIVGNNYTIIAKDQNILIKNTKNENIEESYNLRIKQDLNIQVEGNANILVSGNVTQETKGNYFHKIDGVCVITSKGNMAFSSPRIDLNPSDITTPSDIF